PLYLAVRGRTVLVAGEPGSGKSWIAGLLCEQLILQGYCLCVLDPEGDYRSLEALPGVIMMGGNDPLPRARDLAQALRYPDASVVIDLSNTLHAEKREYLHDLLPVLASLRRETGLPHKIVLDEAHYYLAEPEGRRLIDAELAGYILVTYRVSGIDPQVRSAADEVVIVTRETDLQEQDTLRAICLAAGKDVSKEMFSGLRSGEAALLPGIEESHAGAKRFQLAPRLTSHVRHRQKYLDMPVSEPQAFVFMEDGKPGSRARSLKDLVVLLAALPEEYLGPHFQRHDISRWIEQVFRDCPLATHIRGIEKKANGESVRDVARDISQAVRARYDLNTSATTAVER
ncbi:MAG: DUF87 domain-containing protein, partial [Vicinamibacterales bacterium]|nr:DUF87 domain-containing protein [Vicinamibacterales bacterium]